MSAVLVGDKKIMNVLLGLPRQLTDPYLRRVHTKAAIPLVNRIHLLAPVGKTGNLADSIGIVKGGKTGELGEIMVGPRRKGGFKGYHAHNVEYGHKSRKKKNVKRKKPAKDFVPAHPFERPAWAQTKDEVERNIARQLEKDLGSYIRQTL